MIVHGLEAIEQRRQQRIAPRSCLGVQQKPRLYRLTVVHYARPSRPSFPATEPNRYRTPPIERAAAPVIRSQATGADTSAMRSASQKAPGAAVATAERRSAVAGPAHATGRTQRELRLLEHSPCLGWH